MTFRVVIDGSNLLKPRDDVEWSLVYLQTAMAAVRTTAIAASENRQLDLKVLVDANSFYKLPDTDQANLERMEECGDLERTPSKTEADPWILKWADERDALVISNDGFKKFQENYPWLTGNSRLVGAMLDRRTNSWTFMERNYGSGVPRDLKQLLLAQSDLPSELASTASLQPKPSSKATVDGRKKTQATTTTRSSSVTESESGMTPPPAPVASPLVPRPPTTPTAGAVALPVPYQRDITRQHPALMVMLLDQSGSMQNSWWRGGTKADGVAESVNNLVQSIVLMSIRQKEVRHYFDLAVIGYSGSAVTSMFEGTDINKPIITITRANEIVRRQTVTEEGLRVDRHVWVEARAAGQTPMCLALRTAKEVTEKWAAEHPDSFPPIVLNITDGAGNDGVPLPVAEDLLQVSTNYGSALLLNCHIAGPLDRIDGAKEAVGGDRPIIFPDEKFPLPSQHARDLFEMSSALPESFRQRAIDLEFDVTQGARGYMYNATKADVVRFLSVGTPPPSRL